MGEILIGKMGFASRKSGDLGSKVGFLGVLWHFLKNLCFFFFVVVI
jgi:hypothetical protein